MDLFDFGDEHDTDTEELEADFDEAMDFDDLDDDLF